MRYLILSLYIPTHLIERHKQHEYKQLHLIVRLFINSLNFQVVFHSSNQQTSASFSISEANVMT